MDRSVPLAIALLCALAYPLIGSSAAQAGAGDVIVIYELDATQAERIVVREEADVELVEVLPRIAGKVAVVVDPAPGESASGVAAELQRHPDVLVAEADRPVQAQATNDPRTGNLWGLTKIRAEQAWAGRTFSTVVVGITDTGVQSTHPDLAERIWSNPGETPGDGVDNDGNGHIDDTWGWDWTELDKTPDDVHGHGTHVSGTVGAVQDNGLGVAGVAPNVRLASLKVLSDSGSGYISDVAAGFAYAGKMGMRVVNASLGGDGSSSTIRTTVASYPNTLYVVAAGNNARDNDATAYTPCNEASSNILCVASTTVDDGLSSFSNYGATKVDLAAPGSSIDSTCVTSTYCYKSGTSMATPHVAGAAAVLIGFDPTLETSEVKEILMSSGDALGVLSGKTVSGKRLNLESALRVVAAPTSTSAPTLSAAVARVGDTLTGTAGGFSPAAAGLSYQWLRNGSEIAGAEGRSYVVQTADGGKDLTLRVTGSSAYGHDTVTTTAAAAVAPALVSAPAIGVGSGTASIASAGVWEERAGTTTAYQWLRDGEEIPGADAATHVLSLADYDTEIAIRVTKTHAGLSTAATSAGRLVTEADIAPVSTAQPTVTRTGTAPTDTLATDGGQWAPTPASLAYQWLRDGSAIPTATDDTYALQPADRGRLLQVRVTAANAAAITTTTTSAAVAIAPHATARPAISPILGEGRMARDDDGTWDGDASATTTRQWLRDGVEIPGATGDTLDLSLDDLAAAISLRVTKTANGAASTSTSAPHVVTEADIAPVNTALPAAIAPAIVVVVSDVLTVDPGGWAPTPTAYAYAWLRDGQVIPTETGASYTVQPEDRGRSLRVRVTAANSVGMQSAATSDALWIAPALIAPPAIAAAEPTREQGQLVMSLEGEWAGDDTAATTYQWLRDGAEIPGATSTAVGLQRSDIGSSFALRETKTVGDVSASALSDPVLITEDMVVPRIIPAPAETPATTPTPSPAPAPASTPAPPAEAARGDAPRAMPLRASRPRPLDGNRTRLALAVAAAETGRLTVRGTVTVTTGQTQVTVVVCQSSRRVELGAVDATCALQRQARAMLRRGPLRVSITSTLTADSGAVYVRTATVSLPRLTRDSGREASRR